MKFRRVQTTDEIIEAASIDIYRRVTAMFEADRSIARVSIAAADRPDMGLGLRTSDILLRMAAEGAFGPGGASAEKPKRKPRSKAKVPTDAPADAPVENKTYSVNPYALPAPAMPAAEPRGPEMTPAESDKAMQEIIDKEGRPEFEKLNDDSTAYSVKQKTNEFLLPGHKPTYQNGVPISFDDAMQQFSQKLAMAARQYPSPGPLPPQRVKGPNGKTMVNPEWTKYTTDPGYLARKQMTVDLVKENKDLLAEWTYDVASKSMGRYMGQGKNKEGVSNLFASAVQDGTTAFLGITNHPFNMRKRSPVNPDFRGDPGDEDTPFDTIVQKSLMFKKLMQYNPDFQTSDDDGKTKSPGQVANVARILFPALIQSSLQSASKNAFNSGDHMNRKNPGSLDAPVGDDGATVQDMLTRGETFRDRIKDRAVDLRILLNKMAYKNDTSLHYLQAKMVLEAYEKNLAEQDKYLETLSGFDPSSNYNAEASKALNDNMKDAETQISGPGDISKDELDLLKDVKNVTNEAVGQSLVNVHSLYPDDRGLGKGTGVLPVPLAAKGVTNLDLVDPKNPELGYKIRPDLAATKKYPDGTPDNSDVYFDGGFDTLLNPDAQAASYDRAHLNSLLAQFRIKAFLPVFHKYEATNKKRLMDDDLEAYGRDRTEALGLRDEKGKPNPYGKDGVDLEQVDYFNKEEFTDNRDTTKNGNSANPQTAAFDDYVRNISKLLKGVEWIANSEKMYEWALDQCVPAPGTFTTGWMTSGMLWTRAAHYDVARREISKERFIKAEARPKLGTKFGSKEFREIQDEDTWDAKTDQERQGIWNRMNAVERNNFELSFSELHPDEKVELVNRTWQQIKEDRYGALREKNPDEPENAYSATRAYEINNIATDEQKKQAMLSEVEKICRGEKDALQRLSYDHPYLLAQKEVDALAKKRKTELGEGNNDPDAVDEEGNRLDGDNEEGDGLDENNEDSENSDDKGGKQNGFLDGLTIYKDENGIEFQVSQETGEKVYPEGAPLFDRNGMEYQMHGKTKLYPAQRKNDVNDRGETVWRPNYQRFRTWDENDELGRPNGFDEPSNSGLNPQRGTQSAPPREDRNDGEEYGASNPIYDEANAEPDDDPENFRIEPRGSREGEPEEDFTLAARARGMLHTAAKLERAGRYAEADRFDQAAAAVLARIEKLPARTTNFPAKAGK